METDDSLGELPGEEPTIRIGRAGNIGRGVFASRHFQVGDLIETAPVIPISESDWAAIQKTVLFSYCYAFADNGHEDMALALGFGSMYNHSYAPNAGYLKKISDQAIEFRALREIHQGEEVTINYNGDPGCMDELWFPVLKAG